MAQMAERQHSTVYAGCIGTKRSIRLRSAGMRSGRYSHDASDGIPRNSVFFANLSYSPLSRVAVSWRLRRAARSLEKAALDHLSNPIIAWVYHPALLRLALSMPHAALVYDVMDRFAEFNASAGGVSDDERHALECADIVFTGGRSLHSGCAGVNPNTHCFPSGVDLEHFARAQAAETSIPAEVQALRSPILGYFGAVDERIDFELLDAICSARPSWSVVLIGPVLCAPPVQRPNLHLTGARPYLLLPDYLKAFDICLIPFRLTELVRYVSPTKTPEYLAGGKPVVTTPIPDVVADYGDLVSVAGSAADFISACEGIISSPPQPTMLATAAGERALTWAETAGRMEQIILDYLNQRPGARA